MCCCYNALIMQTMLWADGAFATGDDRRAVTSTRTIPTKMGARTSSMGRFISHRAKPCLMQTQPWRAAHLCSQPSSAFSNRLANTSTADLSAEHQTTVFWKEQLTTREVTRMRMAMMEKQKTMRNGSQPRQGQSCCRMQCSTCSRPQQSSSAWMSGLWMHRTRTCLRCANEI